MNPISKKEMHEVIDLLGRVDLTSKLSWFKLGSKKIVDIFLQHVREHNTDRFTPEERRALTDELGQITDPQRKLIDKNLVFLLDNESDENLIEKIHSIRQQLLQGQPVEFILSVPAKEWTPSDAEEQYMRYQSSGTDHAAYLSRPENQNLVEPLNALGNKWFKDKYLHSVLAFTFSWFQTIGGKEYAAVALQSFEMYLQFLINEQQLTLSPEHGIAEITSRAQLWKLCLGFIAKFHVDANADPGFIDMARYSYRQWFGKNTPVAEARFISCFLALKSIYGEETALHMTNRFNRYVQRYLEKNSPHGQVDLEVLKSLSDGEKTAILLQFLLDVQTVHWDENTTSDSVEHWQRKAESPSKVNDPIINRAEKNISYLGALKHFYKRFPNPENIDELTHVLTPTPNAQGKTELVKTRRSEEEIRFYEWAQKEIERIKEEKKLGTLQEAATEFMANFKEKWSLLDFPDTFYGEPLREKESYKFGRTANQFYTCMRSDERWLKEHYDALRGNHPYLSDKQYTQLNAEIDALAGEGAAIVHQQKERYHRLLDLCKKEIIPKALEESRKPLPPRPDLPPTRNKREVAVLYEAIKSMTGNLRKELRKQAEDIGRNPGLPPEERKPLVESLEEDARTLDVLELQIAQEAVKLKSPKTFSEAILREMFGVPDNISEDLMIQRGRYRRLLDLCKEEIIPKAQELGFLGNTEKEIHETIQKMTGSIRQNLRQKADEEALDVLETRIAQEAAKPLDQVLSKAILKEMIGEPGDISTTFVLESEVPIHFPDRLKLYLELYHEQQKLSEQP